MMWPCVKKCSIPLPLQPGFNLPFRDSITSATVLSSVRNQRAELIIFQIFKDKFMRIFLNLLTKVENGSFSFLEGHSPSL